MAKLPMFPSGTSLTSITDLRIRRRLMIYEVTLRYLFRGKEKFVRSEALATWALLIRRGHNEENGAGAITPDALHSPLQCQGIFDREIISQAAVPRRPNPPCRRGRSPHCGSPGVRDGRRPGASSGKSRSRNIARSPDPCRQRSQQPDRSRFGITPRHA